MVPQLETHDIFLAYTPVDARRDHSELLEWEGRRRLIEMGRINRLLGIKGVSESFGGTTSSC